MRVLVVCLFSILSLSAAFKSLNTASYRALGQNSDFFALKTKYLPRSGSALTMVTPTCYSVSGIELLPDLQQQAIFAGVFVALWFGTTVLGSTFAALGAALPDGWYKKWTNTWPLLGAVYALAGFAHFSVSDITSKEAFSLRGWAMRDLTLSTSL